MPVMAQYSNLHHVNQIADIITFQPPPTLDNSPVCAGSIVDVPFTSTGVYNALNIYYAELIDSIGKSAKIDTIGTFISNSDYTYPPADIGGIIPLAVSTGCHYFIRVICTTPGKVSAEWGPFCIQHCDILSNEEQNIKACVQSCAKQINGYSDTINYTIHQFDSHAKYRPGNKFEVQLISYNLSPVSFNILNTGLFGVTIDTTSGKMLLHVPCSDTLNKYGIGPGIYYARIIADSSSFHDSALGTLVHISIGEPADSIYLTAYPSPGPYCAGTLVQFTAHPNNSGRGSVYTWWETDKIFGTYIFAGAILDSLILDLQGADTAILACQETSFGCIGSKATLPDTIISVGLPDIIKTGPTNICLDDTGIYTVHIDSNTSYAWKVYGKSYFTTSDNILKVKFAAAGVYRISVAASNQCFSDSSVWVVHVLSDSLCTASVKNLGTLQNISVCPNPSNGQFTFVITSEAKQSLSIIEVCNVLGEKVYSQFFTFNSPLSINISNQPNGIYLYRVITETGNLLGQGKLIIQK